MTQELYDSTLKNRRTVMNKDSNVAYTTIDIRTLFWTGIAILLVAIKLIVSYFVPGLKSAGELILSGILLLACTVRIFALHIKLKQSKGAY